MKKVYVAGAYSADNVITVLDNIRKGTRLSTEVLLAGYAPFCPWLDYQFQLMLRDNEKLEVKDYYGYSMSWLEVSDAVLLVPEWQGSKGTLKEIDRAMEINIPVFVKLTDLRKHFEQDLITVVLNGICLPLDN